VSKTSAAADRAGSDEEVPLRSKVIKLLAVAAFAAGMVGSAAPAQASTCAAADPTVEYVVCDVVYTPVVGGVCGALEKWGGCA
jgi:hypothetical protein